MLSRLAIGAETVNQLPLRHLLVLTLAFITQRGVLLLCL